MILHTYNFIRNCHLLQVNSLNFNDFLTLATLMLFPSLKHVRIMLSSRGYYNENDKIYKNNNVDGVECIRIYGEYGLF